MKNNTQKTRRVSSLITNERIAEMVYDADTRETAFLAFENGEVRRYNGFEIDETEYLPLRPDDPFVSKRVILLPRTATAYGSEETLIGEIQAFVHRYLEVSERFERIAAYYVMLSWLYDKFNEVPYLRAIGDYGSGKTRFLQVIGSLCYKPMFAGGATTTSPIFRIVDAHRGTLILDEADYRFSDKTADIIKILNNGYAKGFTVLRSEGKGEYDVKTFDVFGPKVVATRERFKDRALESRFLVEEMGEKRLRGDIPLSLPGSFHDDALALRDKLLMWRFENFGKPMGFETHREHGIHPRLNQIILPLLSIVKSDEARAEMVAFMREYNAELVADRGMSWEADALAALLKCYEKGEREPTMKDIADEYNAKQEDEKDRITSKKMGWLVREKLRLDRHRTNRGYVVPQAENAERAHLLREKYGIEEDAAVNDVNVVNEKQDTPETTPAAGSGIDEAAVYSPFRAGDGW